MGTPEDGPGMHTVRALGNLKDQYFLQHLEQHGVEVYEEAIALVRMLRAQEIKTAVVSSSNNCAAVLEAAGIAPLFDARVDGMDITRLANGPAPAPDAFLAAVVVEDAIAGVEAGRAGRFGCVIGVDRSGQSPALREAGADVVVTSLAQVQVAVEPPSAWSLVYEGFDPAREGIREALCALGNGYFATRGAAAWARADDMHYPGLPRRRLQPTAHRYRRPGGRERGSGQFSQLARARFRIADADWFDAKQSRSCHTARSSISGAACCSAPSLRGWPGRRTTLKERRLVSMSDMHLGALELALTAENWSASVTVRSAIDGRVVAGQALSQIQQHTPGAAGRRGRWRGRRVSAGAHLPVAYSCRAGGAHAGVRRRTASRGPAPGHRRTGIHRAGAGGRPPARRDAGAGEAGLVLYVADQAISEPGLAARKAMARAVASRR